MCRKPHVVLVFLAVFLAFSCWPTQLTERNGDMTGPSDVKWPAATMSSHTPHAPITITCNEDFQIQGWPGNGTQASPYLIEGLAITSSGTCIRVSNTTVGFEIRNCLLSSPGSSDYDGVFIDNADHCSVSGCVAESHWNGFNLYSCEGCTLTNNSATDNLWSGFFMDYSNDSTLTNNSATDCPEGFYVVRSDGCMLTNNCATNNDEGLYLGDSRNCTLRNNTVTDSSCGVNLSYSSGCTVTNNKMSGNGLCVIADTLSQWSHNILDNSVNGAPILYMASVSEKIVDGGQYGQLILANCSSVTVKNGVFHDVLHGIQLAFCRDCTLVNNSATSNTYAGFFLDYSDNCTLVNNSATRNLEGFRVWHSHHCELTCNIAANNMHDGILLYESGYCVVTRNNVSGNSHCGINLQASYGCTLFLNRIGPNGMVNAADEEAMSSWDDGVSQGNYWSDYDTSVANHWNEYGAGVRRIPGGWGNSADRFPLSELPLSGQTTLLVTSGLTITILAALVVGLRRSKLQNEAV